MDPVGVFDRYALSVFMFALIVSIREMARPDETRSSLVTCFAISAIWPLALAALAVEEATERRRKSAARGGK